MDRSAPLRFTFDGVELTGLRGDTLASALLANGRWGAAASQYRGRPRGIAASGVAEPHALAQVRRPGSAASEPMQLATTVELVDGLQAWSLPGRGRLEPEDVPATPAAFTTSAVFDKMHVHADVLVVGAGPAGLAAALTAGRAGARVVLVDDQPEPGGQLLSGHETVDGLPGPEWAARVTAELAALPDVRVLPRTTLLGYHDQNYLTAAQSFEAPAPGRPEQRLWHIRARQVVLATGALELPMVFAGNDRPGVMSAAAVRTYLNRYAVAPGSRAVVVTTNDHAYAAALDLAAAGVPVAALVDTRPEPPEGLVDAARRAGIEVLTGSAVVATEASGDAGDVRAAGDAGTSGRVAAVRVAPLTAEGELAAPARRLACDLLAVSGGWAPAVQLWSQARGSLHWDEESAAFLPGDCPQPAVTVGSARGSHGLAECLAEGVEAGARTAAAVGFLATSPQVPLCAGDPRPTAPRPVWLVPGESGGAGDWRDHFVDTQRDATVADIDRAIRAGMRSVEHIKRYTTIGTAHDQGKAGSAVSAVGVIAQLLGAASPGEVGTATFRGPSIPVSFALLAGRERGALFDPSRTTPLHPWHVRRGAVFENVGQWLRPRYYPRPGESMDEAVARECGAAREFVAAMDASTLGKIDVIGPDAGLFLDRIYTNGFAKLPVGSARYGMMCHADGMVFDDGVTVRLAEDHYYLTTTTGNAAAVLDWLEEWLQTEWPELRVRCTSVTEQWATVAVVGPRSREVLAVLAPDLDVSREAFPFMTVRHTSLADGLPARICRISFSGELAYEINVAGWHGLALWEAVLAYGAHLGITPYGTETMHVLRAEKGFPIVGQDTDGTVTPLDLGMDWIVARHKDFIGRRSLRRPDTVRPDRRHLVALLPHDPDELLPEGAQLVAPGADLDRPPVPMLGHVTSSYRSVALGRTFALALVASGRERLGQTLHAPLADGRVIAATVADPVLYDPKGTRRDG
ncbi:2Fe-2S iron-sulfur cluster-binding protein [Streptacidiphilus sp. MAP12-20]|uniref:2Fe-2S iron-sulfur cluster-binding protein n=1 Tax=Streptacidiphilus sp. MAP12-20 TaxID=3156299 RepID=UPI003518F4CB